MNRSLIVSIFILFSCVTYFGQSTYKGLTPGKSTRIEAERVFGQPAKIVSGTLIEYKSPDPIWRIYFQYRDASPSAVVERIEQTCSGVECRSVAEAFTKQWDETLADVFLTKPNGGGFARYYGAPRFIVETFIQKPGGPENFEQRLGFYSKGLFESAVPKGGCTGTIFGTWDSDRGRMTITRAGDKALQGTYGKKNGTLSLSVIERDSYQGTWKDSGGYGTLALEFDRGNNSFRGTWTGSGAKVQSKEPATGPVIGGELQAILETMAKSGNSAAIGAISTEPSFRNKALPPGEPWNGKCVP